MVCETFMRVLVSKKWCSEFARELMSDEPRLMAINTIVNETENHNVFRHYFQFASNFYSVDGGRTASIANKIILCALQKATRNIR